MATIFFALFHHLRPLAVSLILILAAAAPGRTQSLADASRRAQENSAANKAYTPTYNDSSLNSSIRALVLEITAHELSMPELRQWVTVTTDMKKAFAADKPLAQRVRSASDWARSLGQIERSYIREEKIGTLFKKHGITAHEYVMTQITFVFALAAQMNPQFASIMAILPRSRVNANADLLRANQPEIDSIIKDVDSTIKLELE